MIPVNRSNWVAPASLGVTVMNASFAGSSTSVTLLPKSIDICLPLLMEMSSISETSNLGASLIGLIFIKTVWSAYCSPSLALNVTVV